MRTQNEMKRFRTGFTSGIL